MAKPDPRQLVPDRYRHHFTVTARFADLDVNGHVNNLAICEAMEDARVRMWDHLGVCRDAQRIVVSMTAEFLGEAEHRSPIEVHSGILSVGRSSFVSAQYATQRSMPVAYLTATHVLRIDGQITMPEVWRASLDTLRLPDFADEG